jgi:hypothetical protein
MCDPDKNARSKRLRTVAIVAFAVTVAAASVANARPPTNLLVVAPAELPELAREREDWVFPYQTRIGRHILCVAHANAARLAILDVSDPRHITAEGIVAVDAPEAFDVVSMLGARAVLVRFRQNRDRAVLDLRDALHPSLTTVADRSFQGSIRGRGNDAVTVIRQDGTATDASGAAFGASIVDAPPLPDLTKVYEVRGVRQEVTNEATGTTLLLSDDGLYLIRRPAVERSNDFRDEGLCNSGS